MAEAALNVRLDSDGRGLVSDLREAEGGFRRLDKKIDQTKKGAKALGRQTDKTSKSMKALGRSAKVAGAAVVAGLALATREALKFSGAMDEVSTLLGGDVVKQTENLSRVVKELSVQFGQSPTDQAKALYQVISAGASTAADQVAVLTAANKLAVGGVTEVSVAADGLTSILNAYGLEANRSTDVSDALFVAMRAGKTTIGELAGSVGQLAPLTAQTGIALEEMLGVTAALTKGGLSTSEAMTAMRQTIQNIITPSREAARRAKELGLDFSASALRAQGFAGFMETVAKATGGTTENLTTLFGSIQGLTGVMALSGEGAKSLAEILEDMATKAGATDTAFGRINDGEAQRFKVLLAGIAVASADVGDVLVDILIPSVNDLNEAFETVAIATVNSGTVLKALALILKQIGEGGGATLESFNAMRTALAELAIEQAKQLKRIKDARRERELEALGISEIVVNVKKLTAATSERNAAATTAIGLSKAEGKEFKKLRERILPLVVIEKKYREETELLVKASKAVGVQSFNLAKALKVLKAEYDAAKKAASGLNKEQQEAADLLKEIAERLDPVVAETNRYAEELVELTETGALANLTDEERIRLLKELRGEYEENIEALEETCTAAEEAAKCADPFADAWSDAISRIDEAFADAFKGAFDSFDEFSDKLVDGFEQLAAEILNQELTRKITEMFGGVFGGASSVAGGAATTAGGAGSLTAAIPILSAIAGLQLSGALFDSREASGVGGIAGAIGGAILGGPIGAGIGAFIGDALDRLVSGSDFSGKRVKLGVNVGTGGSAIGGFDRSVIGASGLQFSQITRRADSLGARDVAEGLLDQFLALDEALTALSAAAGVDVNLAGVSLANPNQRIAEQGASFFGSFAKGEILEGDIEQAATGFVRAWLAEVNNQLPKRVQQILKGVDQTAEALVSAFAIGTEIDKLLDLNVVGATNEALKELDRANRNVTDAYFAQNEVVLELAESLDGSIPALAALNDALLIQKGLALDLAIAYRVVGLEIDAALTSTIDQIRESILSDEELYTLRRQQIQDLTADLAGTTDPAEIAAITGQIDAFARDAFGLLDEGQQAAFAGDFVGFLTTVAATAKDQLASGLAQLGVAETGITSAVDFELAAQTQMGAAVVFSDAVAQFLAGLSAGDISVPSPLPGSFPSSSFPIERGTFIGEITA